MLCQEWRGTGKNPGSYILQGQKKICILPLQANEFLQNLRETRELTVPQLNLQMRTQSSNTLDCRPVSHHPPLPRHPRVLYSARTRKKIASYSCKEMSSSNNPREARELTVPWLNLQMRIQPSCPLDCRPVSHPSPTREAGQRSWLSCAWPPNP